MLKKNKRRSKNMHRFFIDFPSKIDAKSRKKHEKRPCAQKSTKIHVWNAIFLQQIDFCSIFVVPLGPRGPPGTSREPPRIVHFFINFQFRLKTGPDGPPGGPREAPRVPRASPGYHFGLIFARFYISKNVENMSKNVTETWRKLFQKSRKQPNSD